MILIKYFTKENCNSTNVNKETHVLFIIYVLKLKISLYFIRVRAEVDEKTQRSNNFFSV